MPSKPKEKVTPYNVWCDPSVPDKQFEHADFMKHLKEAHGIEPAMTKGTRRMLSHIDGDTWYTYNYEWEIAGKKFTQHTRSLRTGMNREIWARG
jgi:hypothetical protein